MSPPNGHHQGTEHRLQVAAVDKVHLAVDGRSLCGRVTVDERDLYSDEAGLLAWNGGSLARCVKCAAALVARSRRRGNAITGARR